jgi:signal peptidase I
MSPNFNHRDFVLVLRWPWSRFRKGQVVLIKHPRYQLIIKRIHTVRNHRLLLTGDNSCSTSMEALGWVDENYIIGRVCWRIAVSASI